MSLSQSDIDRHVDEVVDAFDAKLGLRSQCEAYVTHQARASAGRAARILLDDFSDIPFLDNIVGVEHYQLRTMLRAKEGDVCVVTCPSVPGYERYNQEHLGLGASTSLRIDTGSLPPVAIAQAASRGENLTRLAEFAGRHEAITIAPYMSIGTVWDLATALQAESGTPVSVLGPPPPATAFANNKAHVTAFANALVHPVLGRDAAVPTRVSDTVSGVVHDLLLIAETADEVAVKLPRCASAMGNYILRGAAQTALLERDEIALADIIRDVLAEKEWNGREEILSVAWLDTACSPSTQCWIPPLGSGKPYVEGVYEQLLVGPEKVFLGAVPARLDSEHVTWLEAVSKLITAGYQKLGYVGRCSFDFIIHDETPYLVECNGRWGGTSIPMHLIDRVFNGRRPTYRARDYVSEALVGGAFSDLASALGEELFDRRTGNGTYIVYNVGCLEPFGKFDVIALGPSPEAAEEALEERLPRLLAAAGG